MEAKSDINSTINMEVFFEKIEANKQFTEDELTELQNHILDHVDDLQKAGIDYNIAFETAVNSMGSFHDISEDFKILRKNKCQNLLIILLNIFYSKKIAALGILFLLVAISSNFAQKAMHPYSIKKNLFVNTDSIGAIHYNSLKK